MKLLAGIILAFAFVPAVPAVCVPGIVPNVTLYANYSLYWSEAINPSQCTINYYRIDVFDNENEVQLEFQTSVLLYNLANVLDMCKSYTFEVHALTNESLVGPSDRYVYTTAPLSNANLSLASINVTVTDDKIGLTWNLTEPKVNRCVSYYRVVYWDETNIPTDIYVTASNFSLRGDIPCMNYSFQVCAMIANPDNEGPIAEVTAVGSGEVSSVPTLVTLTTTNNSVNMIWRLEPYSQNHCTLTSINVYTAGAPSNLTSISYPIVDNTVRPNVNISLIGLDKNRVYVSNVNIKNSAGISRNVTVTYQTTNTFTFDHLLHLSY